MLGDLDRLASCPYGRFVGWRLDGAGDDCARVRLACGREVANRSGGLHGGVIASLLGTSATLAACATAGPAIDRPGSTIDLAVHFLAPATTDDVVATGTVSRRGREIVFVDATLAGSGTTAIARAIAAVRMTSTAAAHGTDAVQASPILADANLVPRRSGSPFTARLGVLTATIERGRVVLVLPFRRDLADHRDALHEGALASLVDCAGGAATWSIDGFDPAGRAATVGMHLCYAPAPPREDVVVEARTTWQAGGLFLSTITLLGRTTGAPVGTGSVTYRVARS
jgi:uncharacterized protein (TIGR00369 family)